MAELGNEKVNRVYEHNAEMRLKPTLSSDRCVETNCATVSYLRAVRQKSAGFAPSTLNVLT